MSDLWIGTDAEDDYTGSLRWYAERSPRAAEGFEAEFARVLQLIAADPERWPLCDIRHHFCLLRRYPFQVIYRKVSENRWLIVAVAHTSRCPRYWSSR